MSPQNVLLFPMPFPPLLGVVLLWSMHALAGWGLAGWLLPPRHRLADRICAASLIGLTTYHGLPLLWGMATGRMEVSGAAFFAGLLLMISMMAATGGAIWPRRLRLPPVWILIPVIGLLAIPLAATAYLGALFPPRAYDSVMYHTHNALHWHNTGRFEIPLPRHPELVPGEAQAATFPNPKAVTSWLAISTTGQINGAGMAQWPFYVHLLAASLALFRRCGLGKRAAVLALVPVAWSPEVLLQATDSYADLAFCSALVAVMWALLVWNDSVRKTGGNAGRTAVAQCGACLALALAWLPAAKPHGLLYAALIVAGLWAVSLWRGWRPFHWLAPAVGGVAVAAVLCGPWWFNAVWHFGNPVYPFSVRIGEVPLFAGPLTTAMNFDHAEALTGQRGWAAWWHSLIEARREPNLGDWSGGLGAPSAILFLPLLLATGLSLFFGGLRSAWARRRAWAAGLLVLAGVLVPHPGAARFLLPWIPAWLILLHGLMRPWPFKMKVGLCVAIAMLVAYDALRIRGSLAGQPREPWHQAEIFRWAGDDLLLDDRLPGRPTVAGLLRHDLLTTGSVLIIGPYLSPVLLQPPGRRENWFFRMPGKGRREPEDRFVDRVMASRAGYILVASNTPDQTAIASRPGRFALLQDDSATSATVRGTCFALYARVREGGP